MIINKEYKVKSFNKLIQVLIKKNICILQKTFKFNVYRILII